MDTVLFNKHDYGQTCNALPASADAFMLCPTDGAGLVYSANSQQSTTDTEITMIKSQPKPLTSNKGG